MASSDSSLRPLGDDNVANPEESPMKACFKRVDFLAKTLMAAFGIIVVEALGGYKDIINSVTRAAAPFSILTLLSSFVLYLYVNNMSSHINLTSWQYMFHVVLVYVIRWDLPNVYQCFAFGPCSLGVVFMYYKNPSLRINQLPLVDISVTFLVSVLGVFSMIVTAMPLELLPLAVTSKLLSLVKFLIYSMLFLTATAALILGGKFLDGMILLALMPILVVIVAYQAMLLLTGRRVNPDPNNVSNEDDPENPERVYPDPNNVNGEVLEMPSMLTGVINSCIVLLSAVYALYTGGENGDVYVSVGIFVLVGTIAACLSWIALLIMNPSMNEQRANVRKLLVIGILVGLMMTIILLLLFF